MNKTIGKILAGVVLAGTMLAYSTASVAQHYRGGYGYPHYGHTGAYVRGAVAAAIVGGIIYDATRNRQVIYSQPYPVYYQVDPTWAVVYTQSFDPYCNCYILVKLYQDRFGNYHSYP